MFVFCLRDIFKEALLTVSQSFINGPIMFKTVTRQAFSSIQTGLFPIYFGLQTVLPVVLALTFPGSALLGLSSGISGLLDVSAHWGSLLPISATFVTGFVNLVVLYPLVTTVMKDRRGQGNIARLYHLRIIVLIHHS